MSNCHDKVNDSPPPAVTWPPSSPQTGAAGNGQRRECGTKLATAVRASGTSVTGLFGAGPVIAGVIIGDVPA